VAITGLTTLWAVRARPTPGATEWRPSAVEPKAGRRTRGGSVGGGPDCAAGGTTTMVPGGMRERPNRTVSKTVESYGLRGFKSHSLRPRDPSHIVGSRREKAGGDKSPSRCAAIAPISRFMARETPAPSSDPQRALAALTTFLWEHANEIYSLTRALDAPTATASGDPPGREVVRAAALAASWRALLEPVEHLAQPAPVNDGLPTGPPTVGGGWLGRGGTSLDNRRR
jgi:hypothetical protein